MFLLISTDFTSPPEIPLPSPTLYPASFKSSPKVRPWDLTPNLTSRLRTLYTQYFRITLAAYVLPQLLARSKLRLIRWVLSSCLWCYRNSIPLQQKDFTNLSSSSSTRCRSVTLSRIGRIFPTAASRRSLGRVSVPMWLTVLSDQLPVVALVSHYLTN